MICTNLHCKHTIIQLVLLVHMYILYAFQKELPKFVMLTLLNVKQAVTINYQSCYQVNLTR